MGYKYTVYASHYPYNGWWEIDKGFETLNAAIEYAKKCQSIRDFKLEILR